MIRCEEFPIHHHVHALTGCHDRLDRAARSLAILLAQGIHPDACRIDDTTRAQSVEDSGLGVFAHHAADTAIFMQQLACSTVVHQQRAMKGRRAGQRQGQTRIIKLAIPILDAALESLRSYSRQALQGASRTQKFSRT